METKKATSKRSEIAELRAKVQGGRATADECGRLAKLIGTPRSEWHGTVAHFEAVNHNARLRAR